MLAFFLLAVLSADSCGELCSAEAVVQYSRLNTLSALKRGQEERAAFLFRRQGRPLGVVTWQAGEATEATYVGRIPAHCIAVIHTHPAIAPHPSRHDIAEAQRIGLPIVVITADAVTVATPEGTTMILLGAGWTRLER